MMKALKKMKSVYLLTVFALLPSLPLSAAELAGKTIIASGKVKAISEHASRALNRRSPVYKIDTITTAEDSQAQFKMIDGGLLALQENSQLEVASYQYDQENNTGSAVMNLLSGGLRTISGKIKSYNGNYTLNTPAGSIGVRGTHFEVEMVNDELFLAVWDGAIDFRSKHDNKTYSFGHNEPFNFAKINIQSGKVSGLADAPAVFENGHAIAFNQQTRLNTALAANQKSSDVEPAQSGDLLPKPTATKQRDLFEFENPLVKKNSSMANTDSRIDNNQNTLSSSVSKKVEVDSLMSFKEDKKQWYAQLNQAFERAESNLAQPKKQSSRSSLPLDAFELPAISASGAL
ncbi:FecR family protein [Catenovulum sp. 2E275]|uniref:FecR family protein n=1 Tax=Catenovulum sp. 2E275 TaxID=2980497 RepID=UPI0021D37FFA|nr:FecR family protein [Catenovulum sp. 2E275]MCU4676611.1 FecR family protein [Catenovulum sp. 2E275]